MSIQTCSFDCEDYVVGAAVREAASGEAPLVINAKGSGLLVALCDGLGNWGRGDEASVFAVRELVRAAAALGGAPSERLRGAFLTADTLIKTRFRAAPDDPYDFGASCSAAAVLLEDGTALFAFLGAFESRLVRSGRIVARTEARYLWKNLLRGRPEVSVEEAQRQCKHVICGALGAGWPADEIGLGGRDDTIAKVSPPLSRHGGTRTRPASRRRTSRQRAGHRAGRA